MIDRGVAEIRNGRFRLLRQVLDYEKYDGVKVSKPKGREPPRAGANFKDSGSGDAGRASRTPAGRRNEGGRNP